MVASSPWQASSGSCCHHTGRGHVLVLIQSPDESSPRGERQNYCLHDNEPLARCLVTDFVSHFGAYRDLPSIGSILYRRLDSVEPSGDPSSAYSERVKAVDLDVDLTWSGRGTRRTWRMSGERDAALGRTEATTGRHPCRR
jgi:hypothetical protein